MLAQMGFQKALPSNKPNTEFESAAQARNGHQDDLPNFDNLLASSNADKASELAKEQQAIGPNGELHLGETKNDKEFREMLEKVTGRKQDRKKNKLDKDDFLNLMVTQLKQQDPLKPMDNQEMASQLAQFNVVEQLVNVNKTLEGMKSDQNDNKLDKLSPYLGRMVDVNGAKFKVTGTNVTGAQIELPASAGSTNVQVKDGAGRVIRNIAMGPLSTGEHKVVWDGKDDLGVKVPDGDYTYDVSVTSTDGKPLKAKTRFSARVDSITDLSSGGKLGTSSGAIDLKDVIAIRAEDSAIKTVTEQKNETSEPEGNKSTAPQKPRHAETNKPTPSAPALPKQARAEISEAPKHASHHGKATHHAPKTAAETKPVAAHAEPHSMSEKEQTAT